MRICICILTLLFCHSQGLSAPALKGPTCSVIAIVENIKTRKVPYKPESWRKQWGLAKNKIYTDISLKLLSSQKKQDGTGSCEVKKLKEKTFQLKDGESEINIGDCIQAKTQFSGDEFAIGQWLFDVKIQKLEKCLPRKDVLNSRNLHQIKIQAPKTGA